MKNLRDVMNYCEHRSGMKLVDGYFTPCGGGLRALEDIAPEDGGFPKLFYERQRTELQLLMIELSAHIKEKLK